MGTGFLLQSTLSVRLFYLIQEIKAMDFHMSFISSEISYFTLAYIFVHGPDKKLQQKS